MELLEKTISDLLQNEFVQNIIWVFSSLFFATAKIRRIGHDQKAPFQPWPRFKGSALPIRHAFSCSSWISRISVIKKAYYRWFSLKFEAACPHNTQVFLILCQNLPKKNMPACVHQEKLNLNKNMFYPQILLKSSRKIYIF